jgi:hypothetical protein
MWHTLESRKIHAGLWWEIKEEIDPSEDLDADRIILKCIL